VDYRQSHLDRGGVYDATIASLPWDAYMARWEAAYLREIVPRLARGTGRYLDFACGTGRITEVVAPLVGETVGVDLSESMLAEARVKCPNARFVRADLTSEEVDIGQFDLATSFRFLGNAGPELRRAALGAIARRLRRDGFLIVNNHRNPHAIGSLFAELGGRHDMDLTHAVLVKLLDDAGFRITRVLPIGFWVVRARYRQSAVLESERAKTAERLFRHRAWARWAPDCVIVAQKR
jgi:ubiquinone/menaquinone biosynthesis C-methylase UbiE